MKGRLFRTRVSSLLIIIAFVCMGFIGFCLETEKVSAAGSIYVSGIITSDTIWTEANSPYIVTGNVLVEKGVKLTIQPGVTIKFNSEKYLRIDGTLHTVGTNTKMITYTSNKTSPWRGDWGSLKFYNTSRNSEISHCRIEYAVLGIEGYAPTMTITDCIFSNNYNGIDLKDSISTIKNNEIKNNELGIGLHDCQSQIINNTITDNDRGIYFPSGNALISNNIISNNTGVGIVAYSSSTINDNYVYFNGAGIHCGEKVTPHIYDNFIFNNTYNGIVCLTGSPIITRNLISHSINGLYVERETSAKISYNNITNNLYGINISKHNTKNLENFEVNNNNLYNNSKYNFYNNEDDQINAINNWWGTTNTNLINQSIYDYYDNFEYGIVNYTPYERAPVKINTSKSNLPPVANVGPDQNVKVNQTVFFKATGSFDPDGDVLSYKWDFGDGKSTNWQNSSKTNHSYNSTGNYTVKLTVSDGKLTASDTCIITVIGNGNRAPIAHAGSDQNVKVNQIVFFDGSNSSDPDGDFLLFAWYFGDGFNTTMSAEDEAAHIYRSAGVYNASLRVYDGEFWAIDYCIIRVNNTGNNSKPMANAGLNIIADFFQPIKFDGSKSYDPDGDPLTYKWSFGDGNETLWINQNKAYHSYAKIGNYTVTLTVNDSKLTDTDTCYVIITNRTNKSRNHAPVFTSTPTTETIFGNQWIYTPLVTDPDNDKVTIYFNTGPQGMSFTNQTLSWTPTQAQIGNHSVNLGASDSNKSYVYQNFTITVKNRTQQQNKTPPDDERNKTLPKIISSNLPNNSTNVSVNNSRIIIYFSKSMNRSSVEAALMVSPNATYKLYWSKDDTELLIVFTQPLSSNTKYSITIGNTAEDAWENKLKDPFDLKFTTKAVGSKEIKEDEFFSENLGLIAIAIVLLVIILIFVLTFISKNRQRRKNVDEVTNGDRHELRGGDIAEEHSIVVLNGESQEVIDQLRAEALELRKPSSYGLQEDEMQSKIEDRYHKGEISKATYESALEIINKQE